MKSLRWGAFVEVCAFLFAVAFLVGLLNGCASRDAAAAEAAYTADHLRCVDKATTLEESRECRASVDRKYGIVQTTRDGGAR